MPRRPVDWDEDDPEPRPRRARRQPRSSVWLWVLLAGGGVVLVGLAGLVVFLLTRSPEGTSRFRHIKGLVAHWSFDDVDNGKVPDQSGRNNRATLHGGRLDKGVRGQALWLDGQNEQYCDLGDSKDLNFAAGAGFTFAGWFKSSDPSATVLSLRSSQRGNNAQIDLLLRNGVLMIVVGDDLDPGVSNAFVVAQQPNDGQWHHFAFTRAGDAIELFLDGASQGKSSALHSGGPITTDLRALGSERLWIRTNDLQWGNPSFTGGIDEVCVFQRALTTAEIQTLMER